MHQEEVLIPGKGKNRGSVSGGSRRSIEAGHQEEVLIPGKGKNRGWASGGSPHSR